MAKVWITEYRNAAVDSRGAVAQVPLEPSIAVQVVDFSGATASAAFNPATRLVLIHSDAAMHYQIAATPVATTSMTRLAAGTDRFVGVPQGSGLSLSAIVAA